MEENIDGVAERLREQANSIIFAKGVAKPEVVNQKDFSDWATRKSFYLPSNNTGRLHDGTSLSGNSYIDNDVILDEIMARLFAKAIHEEPKKAKQNVKDLLGSLLSSGVFHSEETYTYKQTSFTHYNILSELMRRLNDERVDKLDVCLLLLAPGDDSLQELTVPEAQPRHEAAKTLLQLAYVLAHEKQNDRADKIL